MILTDVHLRKNSDQEYKNILNFIKSIDPEEVQYFILLGDIFDFCFGRSSYFQKKYSEFIVELEKLAETKTKVIYIHGNHEYALEFMPWKFVQVIKEKTYTIESFQGKKLAFCHGDDLISSKLYKFVMKIFRSRFFLFFLRLFPAFLLDRICLAYTRFSYNLDEFIDEKKLFEKSKQWLNETRSDLGFVGHFHKELKNQFKSDQQEKKVYFLKAAQPFFLEQGVFSQEKISYKQNGQGSV